MSWLILKKASTHFLHVVYSGYCVNTEEKKKYLLIDWNVDMNTDYCVNTEKKIILAHWLKSVNLRKIHFLGRCLVKVRSKYERNKNSVCTFDTSPRMTGFHNSILKCRISANVQLNLPNLGSCNSGFSVQAKVAVELFFSSL